MIKDTQRTLNPCANFGFLVSSCNYRTYEGSIFAELVDNEPLGCRIIVNLREAAKKFELLDIFLYYMRNEA
ncbi:MAG: hypothetical protein ACYS9C_07610, partial [Planctomycetota bacterium]